LIPVGRPILEERERERERSVDDLHEARATIYFVGNKASRGGNIMSDYDDNLVTSNLTYSSDNTYPMSSDDYS
jgi:hypothetical protein